MPYAVGAIVSFGVIAVCVLQEAAWWSVAFPVFVLIGCAGMFWANPDSGCSVDRFAVTIYFDGVQRSVNLREIEHVQIRNGSLGAPSAQMQLRSGEKVFVHATCFKGERVFSEALKSVGVLVVADN